MAEWGLILRLLGPAVELLCLWALVRWQGRGVTLLGLPIEPALYVGLAVGLAMVVIGLSLTSRARRRDRLAARERGGRDPNSFRP